MKITKNQLRQLIIDNPNAPHRMISKISGFSLSFVKHICNELNILKRQATYFNAGKRKYVRERKTGLGVSFVGCINDGIVHHTKQSPSLSFVVEWLDDYFLSQNKVGANGF